jgi:hypothetical protein
MSKELRGHPIWFSTEHLSTRKKLEDAYPAGKDVEAWVEELEALSEEELEKLFGKNSFDVSRALDSYAVLKLFSQR